MPWVGKRALDELAHGRLAGAVGLRDRIEGAAARLVVGREAVRKNGRIAWPDRVASSLTKCEKSIGRHGDSSCVSGG